MYMPEKMKMVMEQKNVPRVRVHNKNVNYVATQRPQSTNMFASLKMVDRVQLRKMRPGQLDGSCKACGH
jgi:hypothetical protein